MKRDTGEESELAADHRHGFTSLNAQRLPQELNLTISIDLKVVTRIAIEMTSRKDMQLLWFSRLCIRLEGDVCRTKHIVFSHRHQQGGGRNTMDHVRRVVGAKQLDAVRYQLFILL